MLILSSSRENEGDTILGDLYVLGKSWGKEGKGGFSGKREIGKKESANAEFGVVRHWLG